MILAILVGLLGIILGALLHKRIVKEDLIIAEKVKVLVGAKIAAIKADSAKLADVEAAAKAGIGK